MKKMKPLISPNKNPSSRGSAEETSEATRWLKRPWSPEAGERATRNWTTNLTRYPSPHTAHRCISSSLEFDITFRLALRLHDERSTAVLTIAFRITDVQHLLQRNGSFVGRFHQLHLPQDSLHRMESISMPSRLVSRQFVTGLTHQEPDGHCSRSIRSVGAANDTKSIVARPSRPCPSVSILIIRSSAVLCTWSVCPLRWTGHWRSTEGGMRCAPRIPVSTLAATLESIHLRRCKYQSIKPTM